MKHSIGDKVTITQCLYGHEYNVGNIVTICSIDPGSEIQYLTEEEGWWIGDKECVRLNESSELEKVKAINAELLEALEGIIDIGKRNMENPKYDGYFTSAKEAITKAKSL